MSVGIGPLRHKMDMSEDAIGRLTLPKKSTKMSQVRKESASAKSKAKAMPGIPPDPLPTWLELPLDAKLPMLDAPKGTVILYTTHMGERIHKRSSELDFDLTDPKAVVLSNRYKPLHDPHLKPHLTANMMRRRLRRAGFITHDGRVLCTLREYNEYRQYLRKISLAIERRREESASTGKNRQKGTRKENTSVSRMREEKVREVRTRLAEQHEQDRTRYLELNEAENIRRERMREEHLSRVSNKEHQLREKEEKRRDIICRRQTEERRRKVALMRKWLEEDRARKTRTEARRLQREEERQKQLEESWKERKKKQELKLEADRMRQQEQEYLLRMRIEHRTHVTQKQREKQQALLLALTERRRQERAQQESMYTERFHERMERRLAEKVRKQSRRKKGAPKRRSLVSNWDMKQSILSTLDEDEYFRHPSSELLTRVGVNDLTF